MQIGNKKAKEIRPFLWLAVRAQIDCWVAQRKIEKILDQYFDHMQDGITDLAVSVDSENDITLQDVKDYVAGLREAE